MKVKFTLVMTDLWVKDKEYHLKPIDSLSISWESDLQVEDVLELSQKWLNEKNFLLSRMIGLKKVGESSLEIKPIREEE